MFFTMYDFAANAFTLLRHVYQQPAKLRLQKSNIAPDQQTRRHTDDQNPRSHYATGLSS